MPLTKVPTTMMDGGPAFSAYQTSAQALTGTLAKINLQAEDFDTDSAFNTTTSRFQPLVAGYYLISGAVAVSTTVSQVVVSIYKNGAVWKTGFNTATSAGTGNVTALVYLNGSTDYVELWGAFSTAQNTSAAAAATWMQGCFLRA